MKISSVTVIPASYATDDDPPTRRSFAVLRMETDTGLIGWGEASDCYGHRHPLTLKTLFEEDLQFQLLGRDPTELEDLTTMLRWHAFASLGSRELIGGALAAIEIALWDIRGKVAGRSVADLIGRRRASVPLYAAGKPGFTLTADDHLAMLSNCLDRGVRAAKIRTGHSLAWDADFVTDFRSVLPDDVELMVDGKYNYTTRSAIALARVLGEAGVMMFEEPIADTDLDEVAWVAAHSPVPLSYGEHTFNLDDFRELIGRGAARILEPDASVCGGITEAVKVATLADLHGLSVVPHCGGLTAIGMAANLQAAATMPRLEFFEYDSRPYQPMRDDLTPTPLFRFDRIVDGHLPIPDGPGLGVVIDEECFKDHPYVIDESIARDTRLYGTPHI